MQLVRELILCLLELLDRLSHTAGKLGQLFRAEKQKNEEKDPNQVRSSEIQQAGEEGHWSDGTSVSLAEDASQFGVTDVPQRLAPAASWALTLPRSCQPPWLPYRLAARRPLARLVISRGERNFAGVLSPGIHFGRDDHRGGDFVGDAFDGLSKL